MWSRTWRSSSAPSESDPNLLQVWSRLWSIIHTWRRHLPGNAQAKRILLVASKLGYQTRMFDDAARTLGVQLVYATDRCHVLDNPWGDDAVPLRFEEPLLAAQAIASAQPDINGIVAVGDRPAYIASLAAEMLGLPFSPPDAVAACRNKNEARRRFAAAGLPVPHFVRVPVSAGAAIAAARAPYPCVLKPLGLSASRGVIRANNAREFRAAFDRIAAILKSPDVLQTQEEQDRFIQVESFIPGREFALEGLLSHGALQVHAIFDKPDEMDGPYFEETIYVTPSRESDSTGRLLATTTRTAALALGLTHGPIHAEMRLNPDGVWMLEVAARPIGGLCARCLAFEGGRSLEQVILLHALGEDVASLRRENPASGVMMIPVPRDGVYRGVRGVDKASAVPHVWSVEITAKEGQTLQRLPEGSSYLGFLFARAPLSDEVEAALRTAHSELEFDIVPDLPLLPPGAGAGRQRSVA